MARRFLALFAALGLLVAHAHAHEQWIDVDDFSPTTPTNLEFRLCGGHYFPHSSFAIKEKLLHQVELVSPDGSVTGLQTQAVGKYRSGAAMLKSPGVSILRCVLKHPRAKQPSYELKTILISRGSADTPARYVVARGLELAPARALSGFTVGDELPLILLLDNARAAGPVEATVEGGKTVFLKTEVDRPAMLRLSKPGRYLVNSRASGRSCSLVFNIPAKSEGKP